ncbi:hypothetical protein BN1012_Phect71 [Candidatus Phaeomarinobacter ectocarpi]|uniref:Pyridoxamine 5'-phosphate oxidase N-terminal domain-containing protein n=1 Tax=Candidatus Phaeomarinibacter ectocarpi TaxID=1458461 RepID=X5MK64_9HYPH|nr:pyridoxamine 5'-phosphate oxidase family protein [Candidatus Phaeomarinobacter ectocarpi]CDO58285.1 hypothetical protein BN1012_Phect71 [Candidatus Phaeomarinobacter ectocarpi]
MAQQYDKLDERLHKMIAAQHIFFTATAAEGTRINISPRSTEWFRAIDDHTALYLDQTGSGNETAAHLPADGRMTIMMCSFDAAPMILRLYGKGDVIPYTHADYATLKTNYFDGREPAGARQIVRLRFDLVQTSCGYGVPHFAYESERDTLTKWAQDRSPDDMRAYRAKKNAKSIDGLPTWAASEAE